MELNTNLSKSNDGNLNNLSLPHVSNQLSMAHSLMLVGDFFGAKTILLELQTSNDPEVLIDLASCMYVTQDINSFEDYTNKALALYEETKKNLSDYKRLSCRLKLGKLLEELGHLALCLELYSEKVNCRSLLDMERSQEILAQRLRLACCYLDLKEVARLYSMAEKMNVKNSISYLELQHALIRSDLKLTGYQAALNRLQGLDNLSLFISDEHKQWLYFDFIFACLEEGIHQSIDKSLLQKFEYTHVGLFEKIVWDLLLTVKGLQSVEEIHVNRTRGLSVLSSIRVLKLISRLATSEEVKNESKRKLNLLIFGLDISSRRLVIERVRDGKEAPPTTSFTKIESKVIQVFLKSNRISLNHLSQVIYNLELNDSILNRIRVTISRLNLKIKNENKHNFRISIQDNFLIGSGEVPVDWNVA